MCCRSYSCVWFFLRCGVLSSTRVFCLLRFYVTVLCAPNTFCIVFVLLSFVVVFVWCCSVTVYVVPFVYFVCCFVVLRCSLFRSRFVVCLFCCHSCADVFVTVLFVLNSVCYLFVLLPIVVCLCCIFCCGVGYSILVSCLLCFMLRYECIPTS